MKFSCIREKLSRMIAYADRFTGKNITLPVLGNLLFEFNDNNLIITGTNLEQAFVGKISGSGVGKGLLMIPSKVISSFLQSLKDEKIELEDKQGSLLVKTSSHHTKINASAGSLQASSGQTGAPQDSISAQDFPLIPKIQKKHECVLPGSIFSAGVQRVLPAVSTSEFKPELTGVFIKITPTAAYIAATDTFRLAEKTIIFEKRWDTETFSFILPARTAAEAARIFADSNMVLCGVDDNQVLFEGEDMKVFSRLIEGNFPEYTEVIPKTHEVTCVVARQEITDAVRTSSIFASKLQDVRINFKKNNLEILSTNSDIGDYKTVTNAQIEGEERGISFNYRYFLDGLNTLEEKDIFIGCNGDNAPVLMREKNNNNFLYVVMPIRTI